MSDRFDVPIEYQLQHVLGKLGQADNQCQECGVYRADGKPPMLHRESCESSGTAEHYRQMSEADRRPTYLMGPEYPMPPWVELGTTEGERIWMAPEGTDYGPPYLEDRDTP